MIVLLVRPPSPRRISPFGIECNWEDSDVFGLGLRSRPRSRRSRGDQLFSRANVLPRIERDDHPSRISRLDDPYTLEGST